MGFHSRKIQTSFSSSVVMKCEGDSINLRLFVYDGKRQKKKKEE